MRRRWAIVLLAILCLGVVWVAPHGATVQAAPEWPSVPQDERATLVYAGDSWGFFSFFTLRQQLIAAGHQEDYEIINRAMPGSHASQWAEGWFTRSVERVIEDSPGIPIVLISLGGNDFMYGDIRYSGGGLDDPIYDLIEEDLHTVVQRLIATRSDVLILFTGYDLVNLDKTQECRDLAVELSGTTAPEATNPLIIELGELQRRVAEDYPNVFYADAFGALQGTPGAPDIYQWSPLIYFIGYPGWDQDCIHMGDDGYTVFTGALYDRLLEYGILTPP